MEVWSDSSHERAVLVRSRDNKRKVRVKVEKRAGEKQNAKTKKSERCLYVNREGHAEASIAFLYVQQVSMVQRDSSTDVGLCHSLFQ